MKSKYVLKPTVRHGSIGKFAALILVAASAPLQAGKISVDFGPSPVEIGPNPSNGQNFSTETSPAACASGDPASCELSLTGNGDSGPINIGFAINFGSGAVNQLNVLEDGVVRFGTSFINVFNTNLVSTAANGSVFDTLAGSGEIMFSRGVADPVADSAGNYNLAEAVNAFHVTWAGVEDGASNRLFMQMLLYNQGGGNFDLRLRYGLADGDSYAAGNGVVGFNLGANVLNVAGPLVTTNDYFYSFRDGVLQTNTNNVPEPGTLTLLALGLVPLLRKRRHSA